MANLVRRDTGLRESASTGLAVHGSAVNDELDLALVDAVRVAPRAPWSKLAGPLGVDPATLSRRWARLASSGDAWVTCYLSVDRLGSGLTALVEVDCVAGRVMDVAARLSAQPWVASVEIVSGGTDLVLTVAALGPAELGRCVLRHIATVPGVRATRTSLVERTLREGSRWRDGALDPEQRRALAATAGDRGGAHRAATPPADWRTDLALAQALGADGRMPLAELAHRTGLPATSLRRRLSRLRSDGRLVLRCDVSPRLNGHPLGTMLWLDVPAAELPSVVPTLAELPQLRMCAVTLGSANLVAYVVTHHPSEQRRFEQELTARFPGVRLLSRQLVFGTVKLVGHLLDAEGRAAGYVPIALADQLCEGRLRPDVPPVE
ncbi:Lrp/AsnC family transcriptional regulator [Streptomyces sp. NPDC005435]|uniref:Lrp/AsnC family transcriptional regulator n=1 Tax=Streptomyces sp. NPDC005435 TaxID=3154464 RepID=UPI00345591C7